MIPIIVVLFLKVLTIGYWPGLLFLPLAGVLCVLFRHSGRFLMQILDFFGRISLESYLFNGVLGVMDNNISTNDL